MKTFQMVRQAMLLTLAWLELGFAAPRAEGFYGRIETRDGRSFEGEVTFAKGSLVVSAGEAESATIALEELQSLRSKQPPPPPPPPASEVQPGLRGSYFDTPDLTGPARERIDGEINFDWHDGPALEGMPSDRFSVRWEGMLEAPADGHYSFHALSDDGVRLWVDHMPLIDRWQDQSVTETSGSAELAAGKQYPMVVEYFENGGQSRMHLHWTPPERSREIVPAKQFTHAPERDRPEVAADAPAPAPERDSPPQQAATPGRGLLVQYFENTELAGTFEVATNATIDFDWSNRGPRAGFKSDEFSVRWSGTIRPFRTEPVTFHVEADDGVRLWIEERLLVQVWQGGVHRMSTQPVVMQAGRTYKLRMEMFEGKGTASARLLWSSPNMARVVIPSSQLTPAPLPAIPSPEEILPAGIRLTDGSFLACRIRAMDRSVVRLADGAPAPSFSAVHVAQINFHDVLPQQREGLEGGRTGLLLQSGDFVDGEIRSVSDNRVEVNSILFGLKRFGMDKALAAVLREPRGRAAVFEVRTRDRTLLRANRPIVETEGLKFEDPILSGIAVSSEELVSLVRLDPAAQEAR